MYAENTGQRRDAQVQALASKLHVKHYHHLLRVARRNGALSAADAEEAVSFAFLSFLQKYRPESGSPPLGWLSLTVRRSCWAARNRHCLIRIDPTGHNATDGVETPSAAGAAETEEAAERSERAREVGRRMVRLKPAERRALSLIAYGYNYTEIGELTGFSRAKVKRC